MTLQHLMVVQSRVYLLRALCEIDLLSIVEDAFDKIVGVYNKI